MASIYDDVEIEDMEFDPDLRTFFFPCPCGDRFAITLVRSVTESSQLGRGF